MATGLLPRHSPVIALARGLERNAYRAAQRIVVLSRAFTDNLVQKGVPAKKIELIYDPATRLPERLARPSTTGGLRILSMGNIGHSQGLTTVVHEFEAYGSAVNGAKLHIAGTGVAAESAQREVRSDRVKMLGLVDDARLEKELRAADVGLVSQQYEGSEFNIPSRLMNFMAYGLPVFAIVNPASEAARIVRESGGGWVVDSSDPSSFPGEVERLSNSPDEIVQRAQAAWRYANMHFTIPEFVERFERVLRAAVTDQ
jgi:colanic acid biosynthesis glycosyl transferase WcaI